MALSMQDFMVIYAKFDLYCSSSNIIYTFFETICICDVIKLQIIYEASKHTDTQEDQFERSK